MSPTHGKRSTYQHYGCRCLVCRVANAAYAAERRAVLARRPTEQVPHGATGYRNWGCRCQVCTAANTAAGAAYRARIQRGK